MRTDATNIFDTRTSKFVNIIVNIDAKLTHKSNNENWGCIAEYNSSTQEFEIRRQNINCNALIKTAQVHIIHKELEY